MDLDLAKRALINAHKAGDVDAAKKIAKAIQGQTASSSANASEVTPSRLPGVVDAFTQGASFGFGDELTALEAGMLGRTPEGAWFDYSKSFGDRYDDALAAERGQQDKFRKENPATAISAELLGGVATGAGLAGRGVTLAGQAAGKGLGTRVAAGMGEGALYGGAYGAGNADNSDRVSSAIEGAQLGAVLGGAIPAIGSGLRKSVEPIAKRVATKKAAPSADTLKSQAGDAFKAAENAGVRLSEKSRGVLVQGIGDDLNAAKYRASVNPEVKKVLEEFDSFIENQPTLSNLQDYRSFVVQQMRNIPPDRKTDKKLLGSIVENLDNYAERISPYDVVTNASGRKAAVANLKEGRELWKRMRKDDILEEAFLKAENQASGFENGLRVQFRSIINNKRLRGQFTKDEQNAMIKVIRGGPIENSLKLLGKFGFGEGQATNMLGGSIGAGAGAAVGGPVGAMAVPVIGTAARKGAQTATRNNADFVRALVRAGKLSDADAPKIIRALENGTLTPEILAGTLATTN
ncbi:hypothetical protein [Roseibium album]|uniref:hypothetical protein n=1 Tax=Roseibium album TaxID=311410 RepID=UPI003BB02EAA